MTTAGSAQLDLYMYLYSVDSRAGPGFFFLFRWLQHVTSFRSSIYTDACIHVILLPEPILLPAAETGHEALCRTANKIEQTDGKKHMFLLM